MMGPPHSLNDKLRKSHLAPHASDATTPEMEPIAYIRSPFVEKFGVPRQSGLAPHVVSRVEFTPAYNHPDFVRGLHAFSHLWLIWGFHCNSSAEAHATVRPPRLGGNTRVGVFASRSPFRPNGLGLSAVRLLAVEPGGALRIAGADMVDGTPVYDIKPYIPYADAIPDAEAGFAAEAPKPSLDVELPERLPTGAGITPEWYAALTEALAHDPRPAYQDDPERVYHFAFRPYEVDFTVSGDKLRVLRFRAIPNAQ